MATNSKPYMNFLGGEVSPNVYKRLDMANNGKWFETAKNIYFGTTGDFQNRRGFQYIAATASGASGEKIKLIPFIFNRKESYCIEFNSFTFRILKDGALLKDANNNIINIQHGGVSVDDIDDISYTQVADVLYICTGKSNPIYTISRYSETDWRWDKFVYDIPPMRKTNDDDSKKLTFSQNTSYSDPGYFSIPFSSMSGVFVNIVVEILLSGNWTSIYSSSTSFNNLSSFVTDFNAHQTGTTYIDRAVVDGKNILFYSTTAGTVVDGVRVKLGSGSSVEKVYDLDATSPYDYNNSRWFNMPQSDQTKRYTLSSPQELVKEINIMYKTDRYSGEYLLYTKQYGPGTESVPFSTQSDSVVDFTNATGSTRMAYSDNSYVCTMYRYRAPSRWLEEGTYISKIVTMSPIDFDMYFSSQNRITSGNSGDFYTVTANFNFFENKNIGDVFAVDSIYSPSRDGKAGQNKTYYATDIASGNFTTDPFWSNGTWRIVTSGLFAGTIELQYSYDGVNWNSHRNFSSNIRTENNVSYSQNYNEYGTIDVDDNVLLRLSFQITSSDRLTVLLDTESYKNRSYYKILEIDTLLPNRKAVVHCERYSVGTPGLTRYDSIADDYTVNPVYEWAEAAWSSQNGYPKICFLYQNRLGLANTMKDPSTVWFSRTDNYKDFSTTLEYKDDDPITISVLKPTGLSEITGVNAAKKLFLFTYDGEQGIREEGALTQSNKEIINFTSYGSEPIETRIIQNRIVFVERGGGAARALVYDFSQDNYEAADLTIPYKHLLTNERIIASEYIAGDYKTYLMLTSYGRILAFKYVPDQRIEACSRLEHSKGKITNICVINNGTSFDLYIAVDIHDRKQIEYMHIIPFQYGTYVDSYKNYSFESPVTEITDNELFYPGETYTVITDSYTQNIVADDNHCLTLPKETSDAVVGLPYESEATMIEPNLLMRNGTTNYNKKNLFKAHFTFVNSSNFSVGVKNKEKSFKQLLRVETSQEEKVIYPREGERSFILQSSYLEPNMVSFVQKDPLPMHITNAEVEVDYGGK